MSDPIELELRIPAIAGLEVVAAETAATLAGHAGAGEETVGEIRLAIIEGCINAIEHAYGGNCSSGRLLVRCRLSPPAPPDRAAPKLEIWIRDQGSGFDVEAYHEPVIEEKLHSPVKRGWGLKLIREFMDEIRIDSGRGGTTIVMTKYLDAAR